ncbi:hypothetical protein U0030_16005 [Brevundimonas bullata]|uniref:hypothetical protein n=1 Tax=Brevundimonas bullata TaxID=13160 RepID=UPI000E0A3E2A|nr:hypothetical protein [Brevundimonas bullata]WQE36742.1 hypothetical protein U0030_16005 [Brevundimonas bullata]
MSRELAQQKTFRFSEAVKAIDSTPKSLRRWLVTLGLSPVDGGWHTFTPAELMLFGIMRHMVDWGVPVTKSADLSLFAMSEILSPGENFPDVSTFAEKVAALELCDLNILDLSKRFKGHNLYVHLVGGFYDVEYAPPKLSLPFSKSSKDGASRAAFGSFLTISLEYLAGNIHINLSGLSFSEMRKRWKDEDGGEP